MNASYLYLQIPSVGLYYLSEDIYVYVYVCVIWMDIYVTRFAKTRHNSAFLEIHIFTPWCSM